MKGNAVLLLGCVLALGVPQDLRAEPMAFQFGGVVTDPIAGLEAFRAGPITIGTPFSGQFTYDPARAFVNSPPFEFFVLDPLGSMTIRFGLLEMTSSHGLAFRNDSGGLSAGFVGPPPGFREFLGVSIGLGSIFPDAVPTAETLLTAFDPSRAMFRLEMVGIGIDEDPFAELQGELRSFAVSTEAAPVPEPGTLLLVTTAALFSRLEGGWLRRKRILKRRLGPLK